MEARFDPSVGITDFIECTADYWTEELMVDMVSVLIVLAHMVVPSAYRNRIEYVFTKVGSDRLIAKWTYRPSE